MLLFVLGTMPVSAKTTTALHVETSNTVSAASPGQVSLTGSPKRLHRAHPLIRSVATLTPASP